MDATRRSAIQRALVFIVTAAFWFSAALTAASQDKLSQAQIEQLFHQARWQEIAQLAPPLGVSAEIDLEYGIALARLGLWDKAEEALKDGLRLRPRDSRVMVELAGVEFKQGNYPRAQFWLERAVRISPPDEYTLEFLGTVFYLEGNIEAALKYWNRIGKPRIEAVKSEPEPRIHPVLLDRAFAFSPASTLQLTDLQTTQARVDQLHLFSSYRFELQAHEDGNFDFMFHNSERDGCGQNNWECLLLVLGPTPGQTVNFNYFNINHDAINVRSAFRWDAEKRRVLAELEAPFASQPRWHFQIGADWRNENWGIVTSFSGPASLLGALNLKREAVRAQFSDVMSGRWQWSTETDISDRQFHNVFRGNALNSQLLTPGAQLKQSFEIRSALLRWPERRFNIDSSAQLNVARLWNDGGRDYANLQGMLRLHWIPEHTGTRYELQDTFRAGKTFGNPSFDDLFMLGILGDTDLHMKAHIATRDGKKGSAPLGRNYFLSNWEFTRDFSPFSLASVKVGPFVDTGKITDPIPTLGSHKWLWDVGVEAKVDLTGFGVVFSYGRDLRGGRNAFVVSGP